MRPELVAWVPGHGLGGAKGAAMRMEMRQQPRQHQTLTIGMEVVRLIASRHVEWLEWVAVAGGLNWIRTLANEAAFATSPAYRAMADLTRGWPRTGDNPQGPWITAITAICALFAVAGLLRLIARWRWDGASEEDDAAPVRWCWRLRVVGLSLLAGWYLFVALMLWQGNPIGSGWGSSGIVGVVSAIAAVRTGWAHWRALWPA